MGISMHSSCTGFAYLFFHFKIFIIFYVPNATPGTGNRALIKMWSLPRCSLPSRGGPGSHQIFGGVVTHPSIQPRKILWFYSIAPIPSYSGRVKEWLAQQILGSFAFDL